MPTNLCSMPVEIQLAIFENTRSEIDGRLPSVICLISKRFTDVVNPLFYRVVLLESAKSIQWFLGTVRSNAKLARHTRHFLLSDSDRRSEVLPEFVFAMARSQEQRAQRFRQLHDWSASRDSKVKETREAVHEILITIGPSLRSLAILYYARYWQTSTGLEDILQVSFPSLRELTLAGDCSVFEEGRVVCMPTMEYLHLIGEESTINMNVHSLTQKFPHLLQLRLSGPGIDTTLQGFLLSLQEVTAQIPSLSKVLLQFPPRRSITVESITQNQENIFSLAQRAEQEYPILSLLVRLQDGYTYELAKREWTDRVVFGGGGCWSAD